MKVLKKYFKLLVIGVIACVALTAVLPWWWARLFFGLLALLFGQTALVFYSQITKIQWLGVPIPREQQDQPPPGYLYLGRLLVKLPNLVPLADVDVYEDPQGRLRICVEQRYFSNLDELDGVTVLTPYPGPRRTSKNIVPPSQSA